MPDSGTGLQPPPDSATVDAQAADAIVLVLQPAVSIGAAAIQAGSSTANYGTGLKLPPDSMASDAHAAIMPGMVDKSLATVRRDTVDKPRLGRRLGAGVASWYGPRFHGRRTANGETFNRYALTAAHKTLPLGTRVMVSNPRTGKTIEVRINDRGPYIGNRVLDLSEAAASALGLRIRGHDWVVINAILPSPDDASDSVNNTAAHVAATDAQVDDKSAVSQVASLTATPVIASDRFSSAVTPSASAD
jgi:rare lipoprotein A